MKEKLEFWFYQLFTTKIGWLMVTVVLGVIFGILANYYPWCGTAMFISWIYPTLYIVIAIVYAWIINPINELLNKNKK